MGTIIMAAMIGLCSCLIIKVGAVVMDKIQYINLSMYMYLIFKMQGPF